MSKNVLVVVEHEDGRIRKGSFEALALARTVASAHGAQVCAAILGDDVAGLADELASRGADEVLLAQDAHLSAFTPDAYRGPLKKIISERTPEWVLMSHTYLAQDLMPLVAAGFDAPVVSDCAGARVDGEEVIWTRQPYDAKFDAETIDNGPAPRFATLQAGSFSADGLPEGHSGQVTNVEVSIAESDLRRKVLGIESTSGGSVDLSTSDVIVAGGRGLQDKDGFEKYVNSLALVLGAGIGASRPVVDSEWLPHEHQIGSSGQVVAPRLYVALAISGAIQHMVGIRGSQVIVAINKDKDAPIFNEATYGIVGDVGDIVPELVKAIEEAKAG